MGIGGIMSRTSLAAAILLFSFACILAQAGTLPARVDPTSNTQSTDQSDKSQTATIEGCVSGIVDSFVLTDAKGKTYDLTGDTVQLTNRVGHKVRVAGEEDRVEEAELIPAGGPVAAFRVEKVHSLSATCK